MNNQNKVIQPPKKRRKLKKSVKTFFLYLFIAILSLTLLVKKIQADKTRKKEEWITAVLEKKKQEKEEKDNPLKTFSLKAQDELKKENLNSNLIIQKDERWAKVPYGWGTYTTLDENGCAIASLAMINEYWTGHTTTPNDILEWSEDKYFTDSGTSWSIFPDFANQYDYKFEDLGSNINSALPYLKKETPVIASVKPGLFTKVGHILVLSYADDENKIRLLDPNDNSEKNHYKTAYTPEEIQNELVHLWVYSK